MVGFSNTSSLMVGAGMVSRGEMALIIAQIGYQSKLLSEAYYTSMIVVIILTTLVALFLLKYFVKNKNLRCNKKDEQKLLTKNKIVI